MRERYRSQSRYDLRILTEFIIIVGLIGVFYLVDAASLRCCSYANGSCRSACEQVADPCFRLLHLMGLELMLAALKIGLSQSFHIT
ncbi:unnamed protein product [Larinioides sclopetarius]|uniref:Uncharacterized protein n=1 Tax=Larinioides sclopetarius TaxID=280406 RepID=A0AAV1ZX07_9ARAC